MNRDLVRGHIGDTYHKIDMICPETKCPKLDRIEYRKGSEMVIKLINHKWIEAINMQLCVFFLSIDMSCFHMIFWLLLFQLQTKNSNGKENNNKYHC